MTETNETNEQRLDFIRQIVADDLESGKWDKRTVTRFPPEPNGYLQCNLRFDDTNPCKEEQEYVDSITEDVTWLGWDFGGAPLFASDYFQQMYDWAVELIKKGAAYVCDLTAEETREYRGTLTEPGKPSPYRDRRVEENLDLFARMKNGEFGDGSKTLKARIDMASPNINLRDPVMYRILHADHHRAGSNWCVYPMYDWAHGLEDSIEGITHSICTLEFENHRPLYDWFLDALEIHHPQQIEFARLNLTYTVMSKRKLLELVKDGHVSGWDDPRMPTLSGLRRRGFSPESIRSFCKTIGVNKFNSTIDYALLEHCLRQDLNKTSARVMAVLDPLKVVITNYPEDQVDELDAVNNPEDASAGTRKVPFSKVIYIEREDFMEEPPKKFFRLAPGREVRLRYAYFVTCSDVIKDDAGNITELHCTYDPETRGGDAPDGRRVKATLHWVSDAHALDAEVRLYDHLFTKENPEKVKKDAHFTDKINPDSLKVIDNCKIEPSVADTNPQDRFQFERMGYFCTDKDSTADKLVFNKTVGLKDTWAKMQKQQQKQKENQKKQQRQRGS
ncbi:MAG: glutamine--tRNA ligase/YqeY domain fusion protein [Planctomycetota bacterium]|jgi:glutaminyl-tRNA synthetase